MKIDPTLSKRRPADTRIPTEERCYELLDRLGVEYCRADHEHADTIEQCHEIEKLLGAEICKNLLLTNRQMTDVYLLLMPGDKPFKTKILSKQIGTARLMNDKAGKVRLLIDRDLLKDERFGCHPCINTSTLSFSTRDLIEKIIPSMGHEPTYVELPWSVNE